MRPRGREARGRGHGSGSWSSRGERWRYRGGGSRGREARGRGHGSGSWISRGERWRYRAWRSRGREARGRGHGSGSWISRALRPRGREARGRGHGSGSCISRAMCPHGGEEGSWTWQALRSRGREDRSVRMIATWRGLIVAATIAVVLAVIVAVDITRSSEPVDRALVPGFDAARVTELVWEHSGRPAIQAVKVGDRWELRAPSAAADAGAIGDVLAALRGGRWHRRGDARPVHATLTVVMGAERHVLGIADPVAGTEQSWAVDDGRGVLVDSWIARTLDRDVLSLRVRQPLGAVSSARSIRITGQLSASAAGSGARDSRVEPPAGGTGSVGG